MKWSIVYDCFGDYAHNNFQHDWNMVESLVFLPLLNTISFKRYNTLSDRRQTSGHSFLCLVGDSNSGLLAPCQHVLHYTNVVVIYSVIINKNNRIAATL